LEELFMDLVDLLADIPTSVQQCQISTEELQTFAQWANELKNVEEMAVRFYKAFLKFPAELRLTSRPLLTPSRLKTSTPLDSALEIS
jgi:hypothetical protein